MSIQTINVKYPPQSTSPRSTEQAEHFRSARFDKLLTTVLETGRITNADVDKYYELFSTLQHSSDPAEREQILERMAEIIEK